MTFQHPLAYLLGLEGIALLRSWAGEFDRSFVEARLAEVRLLLDDESLDNAGVIVNRVDTVAGYREWSATYDEPRNTLFDAEEPFVREILDTLPVGTVLDAACGTGRYAEYLASKGHQVLGVDSSPDMLAHAIARVPAATFLQSYLHDLPLQDNTVDGIVCALSLTHVRELGPVLAEFARVLSPGGTLVISDAHPELVFRGSVPHARGPDGEPGLVTSYRHLVGDYLRAALPLGLQLRRCEEPRPPIKAEPPPPAPDITVGPWDDWPWCLIELVPDAARAAWETPLTVIWHFQLADS